MKDEMSSMKVTDLMTNQKLLSNKDLMIKNLDNLIQNLNECEDYIQLVIVSLLPFPLIFLKGRQGSTKLRYRKGIELMHQSVLFR